MQAGGQLASLSSPHHSPAAQGSPTTRLPRTPPWAKTPLLPHAKFPLSPPVTCLLREALRLLGRLQAVALGRLRGTWENAGRCSGMRAERVEGGHGQHRHCSAAQATRHSWGAHLVLCLSCRRLCLLLHRRLPRRHLRHRCLGLRGASKQKRGGLLRRVVALGDRTGKGALSQRHASDKAIRLPATLPCLKSLFTHRRAPLPRCPLLKRAAPAPALAVVPAASPRPRCC